MIETIKPYLFAFGVVIAALAAGVLLGFGAAAFSSMMIEVLR